MQVIEMRDKRLWSERLLDWPKIDGRYECTEAQPMPRIPDPPGQWLHHGAHEVECGSDYVSRWECSFCKVRWTQELPE